MRLWLARHLLRLVGYRYLVTAPDGSLTASRSKNGHLLYLAIMAASSEILSEELEEWDGPTISLENRVIH